MNDKFDFLDNPWIQFLMRTILVCITTAVIFLCFYFTSPKNLVDASNSCFISGTIGIGVGVFSLINRMGGFDFFEYGFVQVVSSMRKGSPRPYVDLIDYKNQKKLKRQFSTLYFIPYIVIGVIWVIAAMILLSYLKTA